MKIVCTKEEYTRLIRWCEGTKYERECTSCPFPCAEDDDVAPIGKLCQIVEPEKE